MMQTQRVIRQVVSNPLIAVCQLTNTHDKNRNIEKAHELISKAKDHGCKMIFFPECADFIGRSKDEALKLAEPINGETMKTFRQLAENYKMWISVGGFHNKKSEDILPANTHVIIDDNGQIVIQYDKLHQFNIDTPKVRLLEREFSSAGNQLHPPVETPVGKIGLNICYDVRFPELSYFHRQAGADILAFPAAFTVPTGMAHWEVLLRARAIETQCYVVASAQYGKHTDTRSSYGHAMIVDPYGKVVAQCSDREGLCYAEIDLNYIKEVRQGLNMIGDRRGDLYTTYYKQKFPTEGVDATFADKTIPASSVFYRSRLSFAFVNLHPLVPGHVLVSPNRVVQSIKDLTPAENADLFNTVQVVSNVVLEHYKAESSNIAIQNGADAGQTVPHVHVHIIPRKHKDFGDDTDNMYKELAEHETKRPQQTPEQMAEEAAIYRKLLYQ
jgi:predicted amidohydrolase/diadenosine tetraphosphate (Ap4A) HIT family hydrolase